MPDAADFDADGADQQFRRVHRLAGRPSLRRPHDRAAPGRVRGRDRHDPAADPGRGPQLRQPAGRRRQRDDHPADRLDRQGARRTPRPAPQAGRGPLADPERHRGAPPLRVPVTVQARFVTRDVEHHGQVVPEGSVDPAAQRLGQPRRAQVRRRRPLRHHTGRSTTTSPSATGIHFCLGAALARLEGRVALDEVLQRFPDWEVDWDTPSRPGPRPFGAGSACPSSSPEPVALRPPIDGWLRVACWTS